MANFDLIQKEITETGGMQMMCCSLREARHWILPSQTEADIEDTHWSPVASIFQSADRFEVYI